MKSNEEKAVSKSDSATMAAQADFGELTGQIPPVDLLGPKAKMALRLAHFGWAVAPIKGGELRKARGSGKDPRCVRRWSGKWPDSNVAIRTGNPSKLLAIQVGPSVAGFDYMAALQRKHSPLPDTVMAVCGNGMVQYYFRYPGRDVPTGRWIVPHVTLRGDGGYVIAPPSQFGTQNPSAWVPGKAPWELPLAPIPAWLLERIEHPVKMAAARAELEPWLPAGQTLAAARIADLWQPIAHNLGVVTAPLATGTIAAIEGLATSSSSTSEKGSS